MQRSSTLIFDDFVPLNNTVYATSAEHDRRLGEFDQLALFCVLGQGSTAASTSTPAKFYVYISHSGDGENFVVKNGSGPPPSNPEITLQWVGTAVPSDGIFAWGSDPNTTVNPPTPFLRYVRVNLYMTGFTGRVHARIYATQRDQGG